MPSYTTKPDSYTETTRLEQPTCPDCGGRLTGIQTTGPGEHKATPCGCRVGSYKLAEVGQ